MPNYTYLCEKGHRTEARAGYNVESVPCKCGLPARRLAFYAPPTVRLLTPRFKVNHERFLDRAPYIDHAHERAEQEVGHRMPRPKWYNAGIARARSRAIQAGSEKQIREVSALAERADRDRPQREARR